MRRRFGRSNGPSGSHDRGRLPSRARVLAVPSVVFLPPHPRELLVVGAPDEPLVLELQLMRVRLFEPVVGQLAVEVAHVHHEGQAGKDAGEISLKLFLVGDDERSSVFRPPDVIPALRVVHHVVQLPVDDVRRAEGHAMGE